MTTLLPALWHAAEVVASGFRPLRAWQVPQLRMRRRLVRVRNRLRASLPAFAAGAAAVVLWGAL